MELMVTIDGAEHATVPLIDGNDSYNQASERGALDRAYEAKETNPDSVVAIVLAWHPDDELQLDPEPDAIFIADNLELLADIDEGEHTDSDRLRSLAEALRVAYHGDSGGDPGQAERLRELGIHRLGDQLAVPKPRPLGEWSTKHADDCPVTSARADLLTSIRGADKQLRPGLMGAVPEYDLGGDQEVELCTCGTAGRMG